MLIDWSLIITLGVIFVITLTGAWLRSRRRDECLKSFEGFHVTLEMSDGKVVWGTMSVERTGIELQYRRAVQDDHHLEASYLLYADEFQNIQAIYRYADQLTENGRKKRAKQLRQWFHPGPMRYSLRKIRNFLGTASESLNEVIGILVGRVRKPAGHLVTETSETYIKRLGTDLIGHVGNNNDPLLERFIGRRIVFELFEDGEIHEHVGILKNYSGDFLEVLDVQFPVKQKMQLSQDCVSTFEKTNAMAGDGAIKINNSGDFPILVQSLTLENSDEPDELFDVVIDAGETVKLTPEHSFEKATLQLRLVRELDMVVPRSKGLIRHRADQVKRSTLTDIIFDLGVVLSLGNRDAAQEQRLRDILRINPNNALAAANLGGLLVRKGDTKEAGTWLQKALAYKESLPDGGRRAFMLLREIDRKNKAKAGPDDGSTTIAAAADFFK